MRLQVSRTKNAASLYMVRSTYVNGKHSNQVVEKLGTYDELKAKLGDVDPYEWAKEYVAEKTREEKDSREKEIVVKYEVGKRLEIDNRRLYNGGYLFIQSLYYMLGLDKICKKIEKRYSFEFDLNAILSRILYGRILFPASKKATYELSDGLIEKREFSLHQVYRALEIVSKENESIQAALYNNSISICQRDTTVLYYDCTNYFFEIEEAEGLKQYGVSKEHRPNPIVQMGLFMDKSGIPLAFNINSGNTNEQTTLQPLEKKILSDFELSKFVVCTDAGLSSVANRQFNNVGNRGYITAQSLKVMKEHLRKWALEKDGWFIAGEGKKLYDLDTIDETAHENTMFYKERWINENGLEQRLIVTFSIKYKNYQSYIRSEQIKRALKTMKGNVEKHRQNDYRRFIVRTSQTVDGETADHDEYTLDSELIKKESAYDGLYAVCTNLEDDAMEICAVNRRRWEIEESFRILKTYFKARPVYLKRDDRIKAHFTTCFISLMIFRILEKKLGEQFTCCDIIDTLKSMNFIKTADGYIPTYTRTALTDKLHETFAFNTDFQIVTNKQMKNYIKLSKSP